LEGFVLMRAYRKQTLLAAKTIAAVFFMSMLCAWTPVLPPGTAMLAAKSLQFTGTCTGSDMVFLWSFNGAAGAAGDSTTPNLGAPNPTYPNGTPPAPGQPGASFIYPWLSGDITIHGVDLIKLPPAPGYTSPDYMPQYSFLMTGNNAEGDTMLFLAADSFHAEHFFPAGTGFEFPGTDNIGPLTYIDLHGACTAGMIANVEMSASTAAKSNACTKPVTIRCGSLSERAPARTSWQ
jgi:hypothetical protein